MADIGHKNTKWEAFRTASNKLWHGADDLDGISDFWGISWFAFEADPLPPGATPAQINAHNSATSLATQLNSLVDRYEQERHLGTGQDFGTLKEKAGDDAWPSDIQLLTLAFHNDTLAPFMALFTEDLKAITENPLITDPDLQEATMGDYDWFGLTTPSPDLPVLLDAAMLAAAEYLKEFPQFSFSLKKNIPPAAPTAASGPGPIFSDIALENSFDPPLTGWQRHYIGFLLDKEKSAGKRKEHYLPVRPAPYEQASAQSRSPLTPAGTMKTFH
jgi:hypothetical protein